MAFLFRGLALSAGLTVALSASFPSSAAEQVDVALHLDPSTNTLDPQIDTSAIGSQILPNIFEPLVSLKYDQKGVARLEPALATAWRRVDDRTFEFDLREGVTFHDGSDFTSEDVVFTFAPERVLADTWPGAAAMRTYLSDLSVTPLDDYTVRISSEGIDPMLLYRLTRTSSFIISKDGFEAADDIDAWSRKPSGTGPYSVIAYRPKEKIELAAYADYWGGNPPASQVNFSIAPELAGRISGLVAGEYDLIMNIPPDQADVIESYEGLSVVGGAVNNIEFIVFDTFVPELQDPVLREALSLGIDRQLLVDSLFGGRTVVPASFQLPGFGAVYDEAREVPQYDKERAIELVEQSSYDGEVIPFRVRNNYYINEIARAEVIASMWSEIGVNVDLSVVETSAETIGGIRNASNTMSYPDPAGMQLRVWSEGSFYDRAGTLDNVDREAFFAPEKILRSALDEDVRKKATIAWLDEWDTQRPGTVLYQSTRFYGLSDKIAWSPSPDLVTYFGPGSLSFHSN